MRSFIEWFRIRGFGPERPWLILGKGPSYSKKSQFDLAAFETMSLNHVVREGPVTVAHIIDFDVVEDCAEAIAENAGVLVMPWKPHIHQSPTRQTLADLAARHGALRRLDEQGRLLWYNLREPSGPQPGSPVVQARYFSSEAAIHLLALAGARHVRSLGIDGGNTYSAAFDDLKDKTLLQNNYATFDHQFLGIAKTLFTTGIDYAPLDVEAPIRVYVGSQEAQLLPTKVLEHSIRKHASMSVRIFPLHLASIEVPVPRDARNKPRTPFSFQRFLIPELAGYQGRALYLDSDMQVFQDIRRLWTQSFEGADLLTAPSTEPNSRRPQFSVMLLDCQKLRWSIRHIVQSLDEGKLDYERLMFDMAIAESMRPAIPPSWNSLERYEPGVTALLHYTDMSTQPWIFREHPLGYLWMRDLFEALDTGSIDMTLIEEHAARGFVRPSLVAQARERIEDGVLLPRSIRVLDCHFTPPMEVGAHRAGALWRPFRIVRSAARQQYYRWGMPQFMQRLRIWWKG